MAHLTDEQLQDVMLGAAEESDHLAACESCSSRLREMQAVRDRLRSAFASVEAGDELPERIRGKLREVSRGRAAPVRMRGRLIRPWPLVPALAAAAVLVVGLGVYLYMAWPSPAMAAQAELASIHGHNVDEDNHRPGKFYTSADPQKVAAYLKDRLGFAPAFPRLDKGMEIRGCCVAHFRGTIVGSYVVDTPRGVLSVIVATDTPQSMGLEHAFDSQSRSFWTGGYAKCNMTAVRLGGFTYCAVGEVEQELLTEILTRLIKDKPK